jgi:glycosyltransferase involved in cell wall biosynthesis
MAAMARRLLLVTYHFPPSAASGTFRMVGFARHLPRYGWGVTVVAPPGLPWEPSDPGLVRRIPDDTTVRYVPYPAHYPKLARWTAPWGVWLVPALRECARAVAEERPDAVLTSGPPQFVHLLGLYLKRRHRLPWVADFRDPWITGGSEYRPQSLRGLWGAFWERQVMARADLLVANAPNACRSFRESFPRHAGKFLTLTNGFDPEAFPRRESPRLQSGPLRIVHAGELYAGRDPRPFLDALQGLRQERATPLRVVFLGRAPGGGVDLPAEVERRGLGEVVTITGQVPYQQALAELCQADLLLLLDSAGRRVGVPAKLYEYFGAGRPLLALAEADGDTAAVLRESGLPHRIAPPNDPAKIRLALGELVDGLAGHTLPAAVEQQTARFTRAAIAGRLAESLEGLLLAQAVRAGCTTKSLPSVGQAFLPA